MAMKPLVITYLLIAAMAIIPQAKAQLGFLTDLLGSIRIQGIVFCTVDVNRAATPVFPNAQVQLQCGGNVISDATTNGAGMFSIMVDPLVFDVSSLLTGCNLVVATPLSTCNSTLPSVGGLISTLRFVGNSRVGTQTVANVAPSGFRFMLST